MFLWRSAAEHGFGVLALFRRHEVPQAIRN